MCGAELCVQKMTAPFGGSRVSVQPPERGVFPLDHEGECKGPMKEFLACLKEQKGDHYPCKLLSKAYLNCRMERGLMVQEDLDTLGLGASEEYQRVQPELGKREREGFVAGTGVRSSGKGFFW